jgi:hypothetical protein
MTINPTRITESTGSEAIPPVVGSVGFEAAFGVDVA